MATTEQSNALTRDIDLATPPAMVAMLRAVDQQVPVPACQCRPPLMCHWNVAE